MPGARIHCPKCGGPCANLLRYAYSSWLFPMKCAACGSKYFLGYSTGMFILLWMLISPLYLASLLFLSVLLFPDAVILPGFLLLGFLSMFLLVYLGKPMERRDTGRKK